MKHLLLLFTFLIATVLATAQSSPITYAGDFETGTFNPFQKQSVGKSYSLAISTDIAYSGNHSVRVQLNKTDNYLRSEINIPPDPNSVSLSEWWYGWAIYIPLNYIQSPQDKIIQQLHSNLAIDMSPPEALVLRNNHFIIQIVYYPLASSGLNYNTYKHFEADLTNLYGAKPVIGGWNTFALHEIFDYNIGGKGLTQLWVNSSDANKPTYTYKGPNCFNEVHGLYFKTGVYEWNIKADNSTGSNTVLYVDAIKIAGAKGSFALVAPSDTTASPVPIIPVPTTVKTVFVIKDQAGNVLSGNISTAKTIETTVTVYDQNGNIFNSNVYITNL